MAYLPIKKQIRVRNASDLIGTLDSNVVYLIDGVIDMGSQSIEVPVGGLTVRGLGFNISRLESSVASHTMFTSPVAGSGDLFLDDLTIDMGGVGIVFNLNNIATTHAVEMNTVNFVDCTSVGRLNQYRQMLGRNLGLFGCDNGFQFIGNWIGGVRIEASIVRGFGTGVLFQDGGGLLFNNRFITDINADVGAGMFSDFSGSNFANDADFELLGARLAGTATLMPNIDGSGLCCRWRDNKGVRNTYVGAQWSNTGEIATPCVLNTPIKLLGTTTYVDEQWFDNTTDNAFLYASSEEIEIVVGGIISLYGGNNKQVAVEVRKWDDSLSAYEVLSTTVVTTNGGGGNRAENVALVGYAQMSKDDRIEIWITNQTDTTDITAGEGGLVSVSERSS